jgi:hypothetical protein
MLPVLIFPFLSQNVRDIWIDFFIPLVCTPAPFSTPKIRKFGLLIRGLTYCSHNFLVCFFSCFLFFFPVVLEFELRTSHFLGRHFYHLSLSASLFSCWVFLRRGWESHKLFAWTDLLILPVARLQKRATGAQLSLLLSECDNSSVLPLSPEIISAYLLPSLLAFHRVSYLTYFSFPRFLFGSFSKFLISVEILFHIQYCLP